VTEGTDNPSGQTTQTRHHNLCRHDYPLAASYVPAVLADHCRLRDRKYAWWQP
jgi:hypothetical protein